MDIKVKVTHVFRSDDEEKRRERLRRIVEKYAGRKLADERSGT